MQLFSAVMGALACVHFFAFHRDSTIPRHGYFNDDLVRFCRERSLLKNLQVL
ncbi:Unknown protein sequence [Pseudomonas syringae pv. maculicola]|nr:Unknown protein sequence [Pseudomonas syringae pv. maculicola]